MICALLDSPSVTGAYRFAVRPGVQTVMDVDARVFFRRAVAKLAYAPLTSMYFFGEGDVHGPDYRPELHDSDGILIADRSGEWIWRPLQNPRRLRISAFSSPSPVGFGLLQRDRDFDHFQDLETRQEMRPSAWVAPKGEWGPGHVELVETPTDSERHDNIVAFWVPQRPEGCYGKTLFGLCHVILAKTGIQSFQCILDSRFRGGDGSLEFFRLLLETRKPFCTFKK